MYSALPQPQPQPQPQNDLGHLGATTMCFAFIFYAFLRKNIFGCSEYYPFVFDRVSLKENIGERKHFAAKISSSAIPFIVSIWVLAISLKKIDFPPFSYIVLVF